MQRRTVSTGGRDITVFSFTEDPAAPLMAVLAEEATGHQLVPDLLDSSLHLALIPAEDWFRDLTPWPAPNPFQADQPFGGGAEQWLPFLRQAVEDIEREMALTPCWRGLAGYSLAGLFAVWAAYHSALFLRIGSVSGSMWYEGFLPFMRQHKLRALPVRAYFSYGDREASTRMPGGEPLEELTRQAESHLRQEGSQTLLEVNPGNHFADTGPRLLRAIRWLTGGDL